MSIFELLISDITRTEQKAENTGLMQPQDVSIINYAELLPSNIDKYEFNERAAIIEYDGNKPRHEAEKQAYNELKEYYKF